MSLATAGTAAHAEAWTEFEEAVGKLVFREMTRTEGLLNDPLLQAWVERVGGEVARQSIRKHLRYRFFILNTDESNAFSLPGGYVLVTLGLLNHVTSDEELAGVIAHEVAHSDDRDFTRGLREQLLFLGLQSVLRGEVSDDWVVATQFLQVYAGLRSSRRHEFQADVNGTRLAFAAAYDPSGLLDFLKTLNPQQSGLDRLFATHPPGASRVRLAHDKIRALQQSDVAGALRVVAHARTRGSLARAARLAALAVTDYPSDARPACALGAIRAERAQVPEAVAAYETALSRDPDCDEATAALVSLRGLSPATETVTLPPPQLEQIRAELVELRREEQSQYQAEKRVWSALQRFDSDRQIAMALQYAQVIAPELNEERYVSTVARACWVLGKAHQEAQRHREVLARAASVRAGWNRVANDLQREADKVSAPVAANFNAERLDTLQQAATQFLSEARPALRGTTTELASCLQACADLTQATRLLSVAFLALLGSGHEQPLGHLNYSRFLLLQGDIALADLRVRRSEKATRQTLLAILERHGVVLQVAMTALHALAGPERRTLDCRLLSARAGVTPKAVCETAAKRPFGTVALELLGKQTDPKTLGAWQVQDCLLRITYLDLAAERAP